MQSDPGPTPDENLVEVFKALGNPIRLRILQWLKNPEVDFADYEPIADRAEVGVCVSHIQAKTGLAQSTISAYMAVLERAGLVTPTRIGKWTHYRRNESQIEKLVSALGREL
ncbi:ArsR/SmtB family transcription factor [Cryobacterium aureum]|uniref:ArsR/SmtB family transcription factor n=1 Tax=Cryobacterium aureum TaxID=995037 RepID=UPI000CF5669E|nr:metalloregulator ArsR/SmtB family transcription factor [Cryobacterium aureum]